MSTTVFNIALDCDKPYELARFWSQVVDKPIMEGDSLGDPEVAIEMPDGPNLFFQRVPEKKTVKNRMHICLRPEVPREVEVARIIDLGASLVDDCREPDGTGWVVLADPEGNEFCVLRSQAERDAFSATPVE